MGHKIIVVLVVEHNKQLLMPLLIEGYKQLIPNLLLKNRENLVQMWNIKICFEPKKNANTLKDFVLKNLCVFYCYHIDTYKASML